MRLPCQALATSIDINEATITAFVAGHEEANGELSCHHCCIRTPPSLIAPPPFNFSHLKKLIVICFITIAVVVATVTRLDQIDPKEQQLLLSCWTSCPLVNLMRQQVMSLPQKKHNVIVLRMKASIMMMQRTK